MQRSNRGMNKKSPENKNNEGFDSLKSAMLANGKFEDFYKKLIAKHKRTVRRRNSRKRAKELNNPQKA